MDLAGTSGQLLIGVFNSVFRSSVCVGGWGASVAAWPGGALVHTAAVGDQNDVSGRASGLCVWQSTSHPNILSGTASGWLLYLCLESWWVAGGLAIPGRTSTPVAFGHA